MHEQGNQHLSSHLRALVSRSVALLGQVIRRECGTKAYEITEQIRVRMASLRDAAAAVATAELRETFEILAALSPQERRALATSFTLMLELMNACENAYRSARLAARQPLAAGSSDENPAAIVFVLTAHPTEARAPQNIAVFQRIQAVLIRILQRNRDVNEFTISRNEERELLHLLEVAWRAPIIRDRAPKVRDEAEHIYSTALRPEVLVDLLELGAEDVPFYIRSWVGGDKDGHPGVDEKTLLESLTLSRRHLAHLFHHQLREVSGTLSLMSGNAEKRRTALSQRVISVERKLRALSKVKSGDASRVLALRKELAQLARDYEAAVGCEHPGIRVCKQILHVFPALVVPLELRESSDVLHMKPPGRSTLAIDRMLKTVALLAKNSDPRWYARGFIVSMTNSIADLRAAAAKQKVAFGALRLPVIPLFEQAAALADSEKIVSGMLADPEMKRAMGQYWDNQIELMVGYSDSSKEAGVLASRLEIARTLPKLEALCLGRGVTPVFFHGSGGSVDRGGGSIEDQTAWWPRSALRHYKVTVQGEMVERTFATSPIAVGQLERIVASVREGLIKPIEFTESRALEIFAGRITTSYQAQVHSPAFLELVEKSTPYSYLRHLKIGSRPVKRTAQLAVSLAVSGLRAIPWILCWTQTRVLFPTWWGVGSAWSQTSAAEKEELRRAFREEPVFTSYIKALGFTLAKVELPIWAIYLEKSQEKKSSASGPQAAQALASFTEEYNKTLTFFRELTGQDDLLWFRPWLKESIRLRSPMIHPLNLLQILSEKDRDVHLLRISVTGISSGMMTTG